MYLDDILLSSPTESDHLQLLDQVLDHLDKAGLRARKEKCQFFVPSVSYLGHKIDGEGLHPLPDKVQAIQEAPSPTNAQELKTYLGLLTYYTQFLPNMSTVLSPLYRLLQKDVKWQDGQQMNIKHFQLPKICSHHLPYWFISIQNSGM